MENIRIAMAQANFTVGDLERNKAKIVDFISEAKKYKSDIITFPELALCGYPPEDLLLKDHFIKDNLNALRSIQKAVHGIVVVVGFVDKDRNGIYNACAVIKDGCLMGVYRKIELPNYGVFDEKRYFKPGDKPYVFIVDSRILGINICEDIWKKGGVAKCQAQSGARLIINISASPYYAGKGDARRKMLAERAKETKAYICYNNLVGGQDELVFDGGSMILGPNGELITHGKQFEEDLVVRDLDVKASKAKTRFKNCIRLGTLEKAEKPDLPKKKYRRLDRINEIYNALVLGTRDYVKKNGFEKVVIGLSGGIDSSLTAAIACDAIGNENVIGVTMPSRYSSQETQADAKKVARNLDIKLIEIPIETIFNVYLIVLEREFLETNRDVTEENLQARIRGNILMALSNKFGWLVLSTGNKSEISCGYCTLYGDMVGGFSIIKDVPKTLIYVLARYVNEKANRDLIPQSVLTREPSAELREGQKDTDTLPPYPVLDAVLKKYVEEDSGYENILRTLKYDSKIVKGLIEKVDRNEYKRRQAAPGVKITPKAFGKDRRFPITNKYKEW